MTQSPQRRLVTEAALSNPDSAAWAAVEQIAQGVSGGGGSTPAGPLAQTKAYASTLSIDLDLGETVKVGTLTGDMVIQAPTHAALGRGLTLIIDQNSAGGHLVTYASDFYAPPPVDTTANSVTVLSFVYDGARWV